MSPVPNSHILRIYQHRAEHLKNFDSVHARNLRDDVLALCDAVEMLPDESVQFWSFSMLPYYDYMVFESSGTHQILGYILGVDKRLMDEGDWDVLWNNAEK